ncbi:serine/threonine-protein kinase [Prosthecobacter vanneervenii]|uniref:Serine/threonine protein kinase n=1 Tax=Prosthecobacter vanneervenii TaxID=48466 RepID=A0A7W7YG44_9BACT|nr:serine/threonine-protein kinase [Prosthecobacter vanneervenii]MBB5035519.1 serine/threonine protein kinase [Prosthecobacter vanneervenii]
MSEESHAHHQPPFEVPSVEEMGALLPQYEFEKLAAFGGMGAVYRARQVSLERPVAIKILPPEFGMQEDFAERFKAEARAMAKLNHTHIVAVYDFGITRAGHLYLVMEWVEGPTLHTMIHKGSVPVRTAASLAMQLCEALAYAHNHKILHRDIKPGNIMVNEEGQVKVADFGLARPITGEAEENPYGTPDYAAPEILNKGSVDQRADIFAAGIVLYEMLTGRVPQQPRRSVQEYAPLSKRWDELIDKATHADQSLRFQDANELRANIALLINQAQAVSVVAVDEKPKPAMPLQPLHLALIGVAVVVVGGFFALRTNKTDVPAEKETANTQSEPAKPKPQPEKLKAEQTVREAVKSEDSKPEVKPKEPEPEAKKMVAVMPAPEPKLEPTAPVPEMKAAPVPEMKGEPVVEKPEEMIRKLSESDPELVQMLAGFASEWGANEDIDIQPKLRDLAAKYIPALQRNLTGLKPEQRDYLLSEISHVANRETLDVPQETWPPVLKTLRKAYDTQLETMQATATEAARKMRAAQIELVAQKARERAAAGKMEEAKRAEIVAAELARLTAAPSLKALQEVVSAK